MGFFSDLKEDLSQAVNELMPEELTEESLAEEVAAEEISGEASDNRSGDSSDDISLEEMLKNIEDVQIPEDMGFAEDNSVEAELAAILDSVESTVETQDDSDAYLQAALAAALETVDESPVADEAATEDMMFEKITAEDASKFHEFAEDTVEEAALPEAETMTEENTDKGAVTKMDIYASRQATDETAVITAGMKIKGDISSEGSVDVVGTVEGNLDVWGKLNVTGHVNGNSQAAEIYAEGAKITGEVVSAGAVKIGNGSVIIGNITAKSAAIAGAVKGDIDVQGPVILDSTAIVMGNIKSKSVQINNGAVIEGMCSQCYADVSPLSFFDEYKAEFKNSKKSK